MHNGCTRTWLGKGAHEDERAGGDGHAHGGECEYENEGRVARYELASQAGNSSRGPVNRLERELPAKVEAGATRTVIRSPSACVADLHDVSALDRSRPQIVDLLGLGDVLSIGANSMISEPQIGFIGLHRVGLEALRKHWGWFFALGILLVIFGTIAIGSAVFMTLATMVLVGWLLIVGGVLEAVHACSCKGWGGFFIDLLTGILYVVVGLMIVGNPAATALALTLLIAMFLVFGGLFRIVIAIVVRFHNWSWLLLHGIVNLVLGIAIWRQWPLSGLWIIGLFVGIDMLLNGWSLIMLGLAAKRLPADELEVG